MLSAANQRTRSAFKHFWKQLSRRKQQQLPVNGCDQNSGFYGTSKKVITDRVEKSADAQNLLAACGRDIPASSEELSDLEQFVIRYVYSDAKSKTLADLRAPKWKAQKKKSITRLAPDTDCLRQQLSSLCTDTLSTETTSVTLWAWMAYLERSMSASSLHPAFSSSYHNPSCEHTCGQHCCRK